MKKVLIIGAAGFVGNYLIDHIQKENIWSIFVTKLPTENITNKNISIHDLDLLDKENLKNLLIKLKPDYIFHLAAQSSVSLSWKNPNLTVDININGTINLLESVKELNYSPRLLLIGSGEEYGHVKIEEVPIIEENPLRPGNIYAATKACQNMLGKIYSNAYDMDIMSVRAFNHIGPKQSPLFVVADFCKQVAEIEKELKEPVIRAGNLKAKRDFTDVRDVVRAYTLLMKKGKKGETYNVGSGKAFEIEEILKVILKLSTVEINVEIDKDRLRPDDIPIIEADINKIQKGVGWKKEIDLEVTLKETLEFWRKEV